jgi:hypothetical protein
MVLPEFQTPTIFDHDCGFNRSTNYQVLKIAKIISYTFYMNANVTIIFGSQFRWLSPAKGEVRSKQPK